MDYKFIKEYRKDASHVIVILQVESACDFLLNDVVFYNHAFYFVEATEFNHDYNEEEKTMTLSLRTVPIKYIPSE